MSKQKTSKKTEIAHKEGTENELLRDSMEVLYRTGRPLQIRCDLKEGKFNINGRLWLDDRMKIKPLALRKFNGDLFNMGHKEWVEIYFEHEHKGTKCIAATLFHGFSAENLLELEDNLFYDQLKLSEVELKIKLSPHSSEIETSKGTEKVHYHIAEFSYEPLDEEDLERSETLAENALFFRGETMNPETLTEEGGFNYDYSAAGKYDPEKVKNNLPLETQE